MAENNHLKFDIKSWTSEINYSNKSGIEMIKLRLYDEHVCEIYALYLMLEHKGYAKERSLQILMTLLRDPNDFAELANSEGGITVDKILRLLTEPDYKNLYFKEFETVTLSTDGHHVRLVEWTFKDE
jgi:hypothetical protein